MTQRPTILALGGGGARGLAHLGALEVLTDRGLTFDRIIGVSIGSILGAAYAFDGDIRRVQARAAEFIASPGFQRHQVRLNASTRRSRASGGHAPGGFLWFNRVREYLSANRLVHRVMIQPSFLPLRLLEEVTQALIPDADIKDAKIPLTVVAVDLKSGRRVALESGPVRRAVVGSASLPGIFPPTPFEDLLLSDVGVFCALPTEIARSFDPAHVVAIDVSPRIGSIDGCDTAIDVMMRMEEIGGTLFHDHVLSLADIVIRPEVGILEWSDFSEPERIIEAGRIAARAAEPRLAERFDRPHDGVTATCRPVPGALRAG